jgi:hypothetical protein
LPLQRELELFFAEDLSEVQVITGPRADVALTRAGLAAAAYGKRIYLSSRQQHPGVVAHEVAHVLQQTRGARWTGRSGDGARALEREARAVGAAFAATATATTAATATGPVRVASSRPAGRHLQGHDSFEHRLLGDTPTGILTAMAGYPSPSIPRERALENACDALAYLGLNPTGVDEAALARAAGFPIELVRLPARARRSGLQRSP